ncbi:MAG TPA: PIN domain-containing protein [Bryobacteraceae bacterium]|nr:PIN domain-containing protein [Bryobacteraceae bacterium]
MRPITRLFLDSNVLHQAWPQLSVKVENILTDALRLGISVEIPYAVLYELERNWRERISTMLSETKKSLDTLGSLADSAQLSAVLPDWPALEKGYQNAVEAMFKRWSITVTPLASVSLEQLFKHAGEKSLVFEQKGANFQDAIILLSSIHRLETTSDQGALVSEDGVFHKRQSDWSRYALDRNVNLAAMRVRDVQEHFLARLEEDQKQRIVRHKKLATDSVLAYLPQFQEMVNANERNLRRSLAASGMQNSWSDALLTEVVDVDVPHFQSDPPLGSNIRLSAIVRGSVFETVVYESRSNDERTFTQRKVVEIGLSALATFDGSAYTILTILGFTIGAPGHTGTVRHASFPKPELI